MKLAVYGIDGERAVIPTQIKAKDIDCLHEPQLRSSFRRDDSHSTIVSFTGRASGARRTEPQYPSTRSMRLVAFGRCAYFVPDTLEPD